MQDDLVLPFSHFLVCALHCPVIVIMCFLSRQYYQEFRWDGDYHPSRGSDDVCKRKAYFGAHSVTSCKLVGGKMSETV